VNQQTDAPTIGGPDTGTFSPVELRRLRESPLNDPGWRHLLYAAAGCGLGSALYLFADISDVWRGMGAAILFGAGWYWAIRFLLLDTMWRRFWIGWLSVTPVPLLLAGAGEAGSVIALVMASGFLLLRRYRPYRYLTSLRRARIFVLGLIALILNFSGEIVVPDDAGWFRGLMLHSARYCLFSLRLFWLLSLLNLIVHMRLHFMRLRLKLATAAVLIGLVPMLLALALGALILYGALGGSRAAQSRFVLESWAVDVADGVQPSVHCFAQGFVYPESAAASDPAAPDRSPSGHAAPPDWAADLVRKLTSRNAGSRHLVSGRAATADTALSEAGWDDEDPEYWLPADTTAFFLVDDDVWLLKVESLASAAPRLSGFRVDQTVLDRLSNIVKADARLTHTRFDLDDEDRISIKGQRAEMSAGRSLDAHASAAVDTGAPAGTAAAVEVAETTRAVGDEPAVPAATLPDSLSEAAADDRWFWQRNAFFGSAILPIIQPVAEGFHESALLPSLFIVPWELVDQFKSSDFNYTYLLGLAIVGGMFLILELFALYFGFRITGGIIGAVHALHRATLKLAGGDLNARVDILNEDEFGDLAVSFNAMTVAIEQGRDDALTRERLVREMETAREIQQRLLPDRAPRLSGFEITGTSVPSRQVGGDYYDFLAQGDSRLGIAIGDVSGKGMPAALLMSNLQASLHGQVIHPSTVAEIVTRVNDLLVESTDPHMFATFFYGVLDFDDGTFTSTNAGHNPPLVVRADGSLEKLETGGLILGMLPDQSYRQETVRLEPGDVVVLYTDGITEAVGPAPGRDEITPEDEGENPDAMFGDDALIEVSQANVDRSAAGIKEAILLAVAQHTAGVAQSDDITLVVIRRQSEPDTS